MPSSELAHDTDHPSGSSAFLSPVPTPTRAAGRRRSPRGASAAAARRTDDSPLARAVVTAVRGIPTVDHTGGPVAHADRCRIEELLRDAVSRQEALGASVTAVPAVMVACAHLLAGGLEEAHLALLTARDLL